MLNGEWRDEALLQLEKIFRDDSDVVSLSLFGSTSKHDIKPDRWSDHDILLVVKDGTLDKFYPTREWLRVFGEIFGIVQNKDDIHCNVKVVFSDFKKLDFVICTEIQAVHELKVLTRQKIVFSKKESITELLINAPVNLGFYEEFPFTNLFEDFWYVSFVAVSKLIRNDMLISLHLALELYRKCLELGMWMRDRETKTNIHRVGGHRNELVENMSIQLQGSSKADIVELIEQCGREFDKLAKEWSVDYKEHFSTFEKLLTLAKEDIH